MSPETTLMLKVAAKRFARAFIAGGLAQLALFLQATDVNALMSDPLAWLTAAFVGTLSGAILAIEKIIRWKE